jgi:hypothetical protein
MKHKIPNMGIFWHVTFENLITYLNRNSVDGTSAFTRYFVRITERCDVICEVCVTCVTLKVLSYRMWLPCVSEEYLAPIFRIILTYHTVRCHIR